MKIIITLSHVRKTACVYICIYLYLSIYLYVYLSILSIHLSVCLSVCLSIFSTITFQFLVHFRGRRRLLLFNGILFAQEIPKGLTLLCMDYDEAFRLENVESQK